MSESPPRPLLRMDRSVGALFSFSLAPADPDVRRRGRETEIAMPALPVYRVLIVAQ